MHDCKAPDTSASESIGVVKTAGGLVSLQVRA